MRCVRLENDEARMTNAKGIPKSECSKERSNSWLAGSDFEPSDFFRHSSFVIRIFHEATPAAAALATIVELNRMGA
jgi:hypothetical protein